MPSDKESACQSKRQFRARLPLQELVSSKSTPLSNCNFRLSQAGALSWKSSCVCMWTCAYSVAKLCPTLSDPMDCTLPGSSLHGIFQEKILEWVAISSSRRSSWPRNGLLRWQAIRLPLRQVVSPSVLGTSPNSSSMSWLTCFELFLCARSYSKPLTCFYLIKSLYYSSIRLVYFPHFWRKILKHRAYLTWWSSEVWDPKLGGLVDYPSPGYYDCLWSEQIFPVLFIKVYGWIGLPCILEFWCSQWNVMETKDVSSGHSLGSSAVFPTYFERPP